MPVRRFARLAPPLVAAALLTILGLVAGCEDDVAVRPEDQRFALGASSSLLCPVLTTEAETAETQVVASVFAEDGQVVNNVGVTFTLAGPLPAGSGFVDQDGTNVVSTVTIPTQIGRAVATLRVGRPEPATTTNEVLFSAFPESNPALERDGSVNVPFPPLVVVSGPSGPRVNTDFTVEISISGACNVRRLQGTLAWDDSIVALQGSCTDLFDLPLIERGGFADGDGTITRGETSLSCSTENTDADASADRLTFTYQRERRTTAGTFGSNNNGSYLGVRFRAVAEGDASLAAPGDIVVTPATADGYDSAYATTIDGTSRTRVSTTTVLPAS